MSTPTSASGRLPLWRKLAIAAGDAGLNFYWGFASIFLLFYYTDVLGVKPEVAGAIYMAALIVDAALDPVAGWLADKTRTRGGRYRPYLIYGAPVLAVVFVLNFVAPFDHATASLVFVASMHVAFRAIYSVVSIPYAALYARVTRNSTERGDMTGMRMFFATCATIIVAVATQPLARALATPAEPGRGWIVLTVAYGACATLLLWLAARGSAGLDAGDDPAAEPRPSMRETLRSLRGNRALWIMLLALVVASFTGTMFGKNVLYYFKYVLHREDAAGTALGIGAVIAAVFVPLWAVLMRRLGKKRTWFAGAWIGTAGLVLWYLVDGMGLGPHLLSIAIQAIGGAATIVAAWAMLPDTVEYGEWRSGVRVESFAFGLGTLAQKAALGLGAGALGLLLTQIGYVANAEQSPATLEGLKNIMFWFPLAGHLLAMLLMYFYPIHGDLHARIVAEIAARRGAPPASMAANEPVS